MRFSLFLFSIILISALSSCKEENKETAQAPVTSKYQELNKEQLLDTLTRQTFGYFWEGAEPTSGLARERIHMDSIYPSNDRDVITTGGSGFGLMAILVGVERGYISRKQALERYERIADYLAKADRFHGAWPHWMEGKSGKVKPFSKKDNGGDLVETAFLVQGIITVAEYYRDGDEQEQKLVKALEDLWHGVEWDWYTHGENVLYWHWSPEYQWEMNFPVHGYNECLVMYVLAASSPTHGVKKEVYDQGWALDGAIKSDEKYYDVDVVLNHYEGDDSKPVGPLFWAHYSYTGLNPKGLKDQYADYWKLNTNHALTHYRHSIENPSDYEGYGKDMWGLTSSYSMKGYAGHNPENDLGVISPTAALSSMPYTPEESMGFLENLYKHHDSLVGRFGPYDAFSFEDNWYLPRYLAIDQGPIPVMVENYRTGLLWKWFMKNKEVQEGLEKLGFTSDNN